MKRPFGAKLAGSYMRSMPWIAANHKKEGAAPVSMSGENCADLRRSRLLSLERIGPGDNSQLVAAPRLGRGNNNKHILPSREQRIE